MATELKKTKKRKQRIHPDIEKLAYKLEYLRYATPKEIADYRADRLSCDTIADLGSGLGFQSFAFARTCRKVYAVELDENKVELAKKNAETLGIKNIEFIQGDVLDEKIIKKLKNVDVAFCDPERLPEESERKAETFKPDIKKLLKVYSGITRNICIEFPPFIKKIDFDCEREYVHSEGSLRLNLYFGNLKKHERSAVVLPEKASLYSDKREPEIVEVNKEGLPLKYVYEVSPAVVLSNLVFELLEELKKKSDVFLYEKDAYCILTSDKILESPFFKNRFSVLAVCKDEFDEIVKNLKSVGAKSVVLRKMISPADYWNERKRYEEGLKGKKTVHLFAFDKALICEKI